MKKPKFQPTVLAKLTQRFDGRPWLALAVAVGVVVVVGAGALASTRVIAMMTAQKDTQTSAESASESKTTVDSTPNSSPTATPSPSGTPSLEPSNPSEPNSATVQGKKQLIFSSAAFTVSVNTDTPTFTVSAPESYGICMPTVVSPQGVIIISPSNAPASACGQSYTMQLTSSKGPGVYTVKVQASTPGKVYNGNYITYEGYIQLTIRKPGFSLSTMPASNSYDQNSVRNGVFTQVDILPEAGYAGTPIATFVSASPAVCSSQSGWMRTDLSFGWTCMLIDPASHGTFIATFQVTDGYTTKTIQAPMGY